MRIDDLHPGQQKKSSGFKQSEVLDVDADAKAYLLIPRGVHDNESESFSPAAARRANAAGLQLRLRQTETRPMEALMRVGLTRIDQAVTGRKSSGAFAALDSLGMAAATFADQKTVDDARTELDHDFDFVPNFALGLPSRVDTGGAKLQIVRHRSASEIKRQWPKESGIAEAHGQGIKGAGVAIGLLDTGIDADHPEFTDRTVTYRYVSMHPASPAFPSRDCRGFDTDGHGTHCAGIAAGRTVGVAPEAALYAASVIESETVRTSLVRVTYGIDWMLRNFAAPGNENWPAVVSMSLGFPENLPSIPPAEMQVRLKAIRRLMQELLKANVLPVVAIGNDGPGTFGYPGAFGEAMAVGAVDFERNVAPFSGSGNPPGAASKPDIFGYGVNVFSSFERDHSGKAVYKRESGTSMATPYVAGIAALYLCRNRDMGVGELYRMIEENALAVPDETRGLAVFR